jgi:hypothetical protein
MKRLHPVALWRCLRRARRLALTISGVLGAVACWAGPRIYSAADGYLRSTIREQAADVAATQAGRVADLEKAAAANVLHDAVSDANQANIKESLDKLEQTVTSRFNRLENKLDRAMGGDVNPPTGVARAK